MKDAQYNRLFFDVNSTKKYLQSLMKGLRPTSTSQTAPPTIERPDKIYFAIGLTSNHGSNIRYDSASLSLQYFSIQASDLNLSDAQVSFVQILARSITLGDHCPLPSGLALRPGSQDVHTYNLATSFDYPSTGASHNVRKVHTTDRRTAKKSAQKDVNDEAAAPLDPPWNVPPNDSYSLTCNPENPALLQAPPYAILPMQPLYSGWTDTQSSECTIPSISHAVINQDTAPHVQMNEASTTNICQVNRPTAAMVQDLPTTSALPTAAKKSRKRGKRKSLPRSTSSKKQHLESISSYPLNNNQDIATGPPCPSSTIDHPHAIDPNPCVCPKDLLIDPDLDHRHQAADPKSDLHLRATRHTQMKPNCNTTSPDNNKDDNATITTGSRPRSWTPTRQLRKSIDVVKRTLRDSLPRY